MSQNEYKHWRLDHDLDNICWLTLDRAGESANSLSSEVLGELEQIVVWLDEASVDRLRRRSDLEATVIQVQDGRSLHASCPVIRVGPAVVTVPEELWPAPTRPVRGRPVVLAVPAGLDLVPGERVTVRWG